MVDKKKVMWISEGPAQPSGMGTVTKHVTPALTDKYSVFCVDWGHNKLPAYSNNVVLLPGDDGQFAKNVLPLHIADVKPDVLISLADIRMVFYISQMLNRPPWIAYVPIDGTLDKLCIKPWPIIWLNAMYKAEQVVAQSKFGQTTLLKSGLNNVEYIPHGVDTNIYKPLPNKYEIRKEYGIEHFDFIITFVGKNQERKMVAYLLKAFKLFRQNIKKNVLLLMLTQYGVTQGYDGWELAYCAENLGLKAFDHRLPSKDYSVRIVDPYSTHRIGLTDTEVNTIYNIGDVSWNGGNEGFGLSLVESMAAGVPVVSPSYTTAPEIIGEHGYLTTTQGTIMSQVGVEFCIPDVKDTATKFEEAYNDKKTLQQKSLSGRKHMINTYDWSVVTPMWYNVIDKVFKEKPLDDEWQEVVDK